MKKMNSSDLISGGSSRDARLWNCRISRVSCVDKSFIFNELIGVNKNIVRTVVSDWGAFLLC